MGGGSRRSRRPGNIYFVSRNLSGSTAPSNTAWVNPHIEFPQVGYTGNDLVICNSETLGDNPSYGSGFSAHCADNSPQQCAEIEGPIDDNYVYYSQGQHGTSGTNVGANLAATLEVKGVGTGQSSTEAIGAGYIKGNAVTSLNFPWATQVWSGENGEISATPPCITVNDPSGGNGDA